VEPPRIAGRARTAAVTIDGRAFAEEVRMQRRVIGHSPIVRGVVGLAMVTLAACGSTTPSASTPVATGAATPASVASSTPAAASTSAPAAAAEEITFWSWVPDVDKQVEAFNASHTDIHVTYVNNGNGNTEYQKLRTNLQAGTDIPDVVQIEYQHLPGFIARGNIANLAQYGAADVASQFVPWTWAQVSQGDGIFAYPQDAGPMIQMCNKTVLAKYGIAAAPKTWDEFATAAATVHATDATAYLNNFTDDQGWFFGLLWQAGAKPFVINGSEISINFTSAEATKVAKFWGDLLKSGNLSPAATWSSDWNTALDKGQVACWQAGAWGPESIIPAAPDTKGQWEVSLMPQWTAGGASNGNYGGSTIAVTSASQHQKAGDAFARWLTTDPAVTLAMTGGGAQLFPVQSAVTSNAEWTAATNEFFGGQATHQVMAEAMSHVDPSFGWSPFTDYVYGIYATDLVEVHAGKMTFEALMADLQTKAAQYAADQGFTVK
jgi:multiple sugar transport system substrate-binding protein